MWQTATDADIAEVAAAIGDRSRAKVLMALAGGGVLPASALAAEAGVSVSTISGHLARLREAKLLTVEHDGRHRYYRLASTDVARALEELARIARPLPVTSLRDSVRNQALMRARLCYDHLAGRLGVVLLAALVDGDVLTGTAAGGYRITAAGLGRLAAFGIEVEEFSRRRPAIRYCVDWGERRHHLAGALGAAVADRLFALGWLRRGRARRVVHLTDEGRTGLNETFGVPLDWDEAE
ncbi:metalloregulator ArsR/SmtB family transcription factor [Nonomuraea roseoviolacea subsp. roseoviolacea]|uniref:DNA-binding transcriptional ArsR family regulator n=1 Tax=Nonomuraea roseoviolacea subsp. carminata TaxID=160689 RepID=A0ABT1K798_9ACTN|nr:helix-turn-helix domain-containing protein [Nonomuraea roseoviolacea]MCP2349311.1 DNA-binding transcriptional ArsR family regulator [Nonomuraea roseoviolacea subsp. carminata]